VIFLKDKIIEHLSNSIDESLVESLIKSYERVKSDFVKGDYEGALLKSGKFVENIFRILKFLKNGSIVEEIKQGEFESIRKDLETVSSDKLPESVRILIPRIASSMIYDTRSKMGAAHQKSIEPDFIDAKLTISASDWIVAELLRLYHTRETEEVIKLMKNIVKEYVPFVEVKRGSKFVTMKGDCKEKILVSLLHAGDDGLTRAEVGKLIHDYTPGRITQSLNELEAESKIGKALDDYYVILNPGEEDISKKINRFP